MTAIPGVVLATWFKGRGAAIVPGETGAEDLAALVPLGEPVSAGRPPIAPSLVASLELAIGDGAGVSVQAGSGWRITRAGSTEWGGRVIVELEWPSLTQEEWDQLRDWMLTQSVLGGTGGTLRAMTIAIDGEDLAGHDVEVRAIEVPAVIETLLDRVEGRTGIYKFGPIRCEEVL
jgi:hypothetical protein